MAKINVLITGIGSAGVGEQILKALRMSDLDIFIIGTDMTNICYNKNNVDKFFTVPSVSDIKYGKYIRNLIKTNNIKAIFPGSEKELKYFSDNIEKFSDIYISINNKRLINLCLNKFNLYERLSKSGITIPKYNKIDKINDCKKIDYFPVVLKPNTDSGGSSHIYIASDKSELIMFTEYMIKYGIDIVAQEYIDYSDNEYTIGVSSDSKGNILGSIILKRLINSGLSVNKRFKLNNKSIVVSSGISQGQFLFNESIKKQVEDIAKKIGSTGPINIQGRFVNNKLLVMEINPRLSGTTSLRAIVGYNEPANMIKQNVLLEKVNYSYHAGVVLRSIMENKMSL